MTASLYTQIARPCAPCPRHAHSGPRDHFYPKVSWPDVMVDASRPKPRRKVEPMKPSQRIAAYRAQNRGRDLTPRQKRQVLRTSARAAYRLVRPS